VSPPLFDLPDDRRAGKAGLPADDRDVTNGLVVPDENWYGKPYCVRHGAMNRVDPVEYIYRCQMCGVGARWEAAEHRKVPPLSELYRRSGIDVEAGEHDIVYETGRFGRAARNENIEKMLAIFMVTDDDPGYVDSEQYGYRFTLHFNIEVKAHWSEMFIYPDGVLEAKQSFENDPIGFLVDAYLEPRYDDDVTEVVNMSTMVEYDPDEEPPPSDGETND
jgi:hypothetical protein